MIEKKATPKSSPNQNTHTDDTASQEKQAAYWQKMDGYPITYYDLAPSIDEEFKHFKVEVRGLFEAGPHQRYAQQLSDVINQAVEKMENGQILEVRFQFTVVCNDSYTRMVFGIHRQPTPNDLAIDCIMQVAMGSDGNLEPRFSKAGDGDIARMANIFNMEVRRD